WRDWRNAQTSGFEKEYGRSSTKSVGSLRCELVLRSRRYTPGDFGLRSTATGDADVGDTYKRQAGCCLWTAQTSRKPMLDDLPVASNVLTQPEPWAVPQPLGRSWFGRRGVKSVRFLSLPCLLVRSGTS